MTICLCTLVGGVGGEDGGARDLETLPLAVAQQRLLALREGRHAADVEARQRRVPERGEER
jgi:hypothetical protein